MGSEQWQGEPPKSVKELEADVLVLEQHNDALEDQLTILQRRLKELEGDLEASKLVNAQLRDALLRAVEGTSR